MTIDKSAFSEDAENLFAKRLVNELDSSIASLPHDISERLRVARLQAVERRTQIALETAQSARPLFVPASRGSLALQGVGGPAISGGGWFGEENSPKSALGKLFQSFASALPLIALVAGLLTIAAVQDDNRAQEVADVDAALLTDDLPVEAYADPGFAQFLKGNAPAVSSANPQTSNE